MKTRQLDREAWGSRRKHRLWRGLRGALGCGVATLFCCLSVLGQTNSPQAQARVNLEQWMKQTEQALTNVHDYTALFHRQEFVGGKLLPEEVTFLKFQRPLKVYLRWLSPHKGQESLYVAGTNHNKIRAHAGGLLGMITVNLEPTGAKAMEDSRHPITEAGLHHLVGKITANMRRALRAGEFEAKDHGEQTVYGRKTRELEGILSKDPAKGYYCYRCIVNLDLETRMPIRTQIFDWENRLVECYGYEQLKLNPGLTDKDFDPRNPEYHF
jgi:hypothetical protein